MKKYALIIVPFISVLFARAQQDTSLVYFDMIWKETTKEHSSYFRKKFKRGNDWGVIDYFASGVPQMRGVFSNDSCTVKTGDFTWYSSTGQVTHTCRYSKGEADGMELYYYENGSKQIEGSYKMGKMEGEWIAYYPSGTLSGKAMYKDGEQEVAKFFNEDGSVKRDITAFIRQAEFPDGMNGLIRYLHTNLEYPKKAVKAGIKGTVVVQFIVLPDGRIADAEIAQSVEASLDKEALRVVKKMPYWVPAIWGGKYVKAYMKQPITFRFE